MSQPIDSDTTDDLVEADGLEDQAGETLGQFDDEDVLPDNDRPYGVQRFGTTPLEESQGESLDQRISEETPDPIADLSYDFPDENTRPTVENTLAEDDPTIDVPADDATGVGSEASEVDVVGHVEATGIEQESDTPYQVSDATERLERSETDELEPVTEDEPDLPTPR